MKKLILFVSAFVCLSMGAYAGEVSPFTMTVNDFDTNFIAGSDIEGTFQVNNLDPELDLNFAVELLYLGEYEVNQLDLEWFKLPNETFTIAASTSEVFSFYINLPEDIEPGDYKADLRVLVVNNTSNDVDSGEIAINIATAVADSVDVVVVGGAEEVAELEVEEEELEEEELEEEELEEEEEGVDLSVNSIINYLSDNFDRLLMIVIFLMLLNLYSKDDKKRKKKKK